jgi:hypothetical protein
MIRNQAAALQGLGRLPSIAHYLASGVSALNIAELELGNLSVIAFTGEIYA